MADDDPRRYDEQNGGRDEHSPPPRRDRSPRRSRSKSRSRSRSRSRDRRRSRSREARRRSPSRSGSRDRSRDRYRRRSGSRDRNERRGGSPRYDDYDRRGRSPPRGGGYDDRRGRSPPRRRTPPARGLQLYVAGFTFASTERDIVDKFSRYGRVQDVRIMKHLDTGLSRGFGFVVMSTEEEAERCVRHLNNRDWNGRRLQVEVARNTR
eukprot:scaffold7.g3459.t1